MARSTELLHTDMALAIIIHTLTHLALITIHSTNIEVLIIMLLIDIIRGDTTEIMAMVITVIIIIQILAIIQRMVTQVMILIQETRFDIEMGEK